MRLHWACGRLGRLLWASSPAPGTGPGGRPPPRRGLGVAGEGGVPASSSSSGLLVPHETQQPVPGGELDRFPRPSLRLGHCWLTVRKLPRASQASGRRPAQPAQLPGPEGRQGTDGQRPQLCLQHPSRSGGIKVAVSRILVSGSAPSSASVPVLGEWQPHLPHPGAQGALPNGLRAAVPPGPSTYQSCLADQELAASLPSSGNLLNFYSTICLRSSMQWRERSTQIKKGSSLHNTTFRSTLKGLPPRVLR